MDLKNLESEPFSEAVLVQLSPFNVENFQAVKKTNERGSYTAHNARIVSEGTTYTVSLRKATYDKIRLCLLTDPQAQLSAYGPDADGTITVAPFLGR